MFAPVEKLVCQMCYCLFSITSAAVLNNHTQRQSGKKAADKEKALKKKQCSDQHTMLSLLEDILFHLNVQMRRDGSSCVKNENGHFEGDIQAPGKFLTIVRPADHIFKQV